MKYFSFSFLLLFLLSACSTHKDIEFKILQFNIWQEGTVVPDGYDAIVDEIARLDPDFVTLSEVRNYKDTRFSSRIVASLAQKGKVYYSFYGDDTGLLSRYPISDSSSVCPMKDGRGTIHKLIAQVHGREVAVYSAHLDYRDYAVYLPRGYDGASWEKLPAPITDVDSILTSNMTSQRDEAIRCFINESQKDIAAGRLVFIGGDFNEPSHLDWTEATKDLYDHQGLVIPWTCTILLEQAGFRDSYREKYPDPLTHPGFTYPADCKSVDVKKLAWAPDADDRDRIDYIFYYPDAKLMLTNSVIVGPKGSVARNERVQETSQDVFVEPFNIWPTDHKAVLSTFRLTSSPL